MPIARLHRNATALLVVDLQEKLLPAIPQAESVVARSRLLIEAAKILGCPIAVTEQYPKGLGRTVALIASALGDQVAHEEKTRFSAATPAVCRMLDERQIDSVLLCGVETHVCMLQTALDLLAKGWHVFIAVDAAASRRAADHETALQRMAASGVMLTTAESAVMEWLEVAGTDAFKQVLPLIK